MNMDWRRRFLVSVGSTVILLLILLTIVIDQESNSTSNNRKDVLTSAATPPQDFTVTYKEVENPVTELAKISKAKKQTKEKLDESISSQNNDLANQQVPETRTAPSFAPSPVVSQPKDQFPPRILIINPGSGAENVPINTDIGISFDEELDPSTIHEYSVVLKDSGGEIIKTNIIYHYKTIVIKPLSNLEYNTIYSVILTKQIQDVDGNGLDTDYTSTFRTLANAVEVDLTSPKIISVEPAGNSYNVAIDQAIKVTFDEEINAGTVNDQNVLLKDSLGKLISSQITYTNKVVSILPDQPLNYYSQYFLTVTKEIEDMVGNAMEEDFQSSFQTTCFPVIDGLISDYETGTLEGWNENSTLFKGGKLSEHAMQLINEANSGTEGKRYFNSAILKEYDNLELDLNLGRGYLLPGDASAVVFEQAGWRMVSLFDYVTNGLDGWQHVIIPLSDFPLLEKEEGIAFMTFRFWNYESNTYLIDNIRLTNNTEIDLESPTNLQGQTISQTEIGLNWEGTGPTYNIYQDGVKIGSTNQADYTVSGLKPGNSYSYYVTTTDGNAESIPSSTVNVETTPAEKTRLMLSDFESGLDGWNTDASLVEGKDSTGALRLSNSENGSAETRKEYNSEITKDYSQIEFDLNLHGNTILPGDAGALVFEQGGWKMAELVNYVQNGLDGWQHVIIPFADISEFDPQGGIVHILFRFWNHITGNYDIDNILLS